MTTPKLPYSKDGYLYLIHLDSALSHARHYVGWTRDVHERFARHVDGRGSPMLAAALAAGIGFRVVAFGKGAKKDERFIKNHHRTGSFCPLCKPEQPLPFGSSLDVPDGLIAVPKVKASGAAKVEVIGDTVQ